jgi:hypothetical protein
MDRHSPGACHWTSAGFSGPGPGELFVPWAAGTDAPTLIEAHVPFPDLNAVFVSTVEFV